MAAIISTVKYSRPFEIWKLGFNSITKSLSGDKESISVGITVFPDLKSTIVEPGENIFVFGSAAPWLKTTSSQRDLFYAGTNTHIKGEFVSAGLPPETETIQIPTLALAALAQPANFAARFKQLEHKAKNSRAAVVLSGAGVFTEKGLDYRSASYLQFFRNELASFLDTIVARQNIHMIGLSTAETRDDVDFDMQDLVLRMHAAHAPIQHSGLNGHEILSIVSNCSLVLTDNREVAAVSRRCGALVLFFANQFAEELPEAGIYGPGLFEPYSISAAAIERRLMRLRAVPQEAVRREISTLIDATKAACRSRSAIIVA